MPASPIEFTDVWRSFDGERGLSGLDLVVPHGTVFGLVGPSGSGKSTVARLVVGVEVPDRGSVTVLGRPPSALTAPERARIGYLPQSSVLYPELTLRHNLHLVASLYGMPWRVPGLTGRRGRAARRRIRDALAFVDLTGHQRTRLADASGGEQRRLGLAAAVVHDPDLLVLDEPTAGVDPVLRRQIWDRLRERCEQGATVLVTTQYVEEATHCDTVALLVDGRLLAVDAPAALHALADDGADDGDEIRTFDDVFVALVRRQRRSATDGPSHG